MVVSAGTAGWAFGDWRVGVGVAALVQTVVAFVGYFAALWKRAPAAVVEALEKAEKF
jgi:hypothetical protein